ncbi:segregation/condensation protein A, partial [Thermodesulfobacteriota bacterium]
IMDVLEGESMTTFDALFEKGASREVLIATFLAILEMIKRRMIRASQAQFIGPIRIYLSIVKDGNEDESTGTGSANGE